MTTTLPPRSAEAAPAAVRPRRRRSSRLLLLGVVLAVVGALLAAYVYSLAVSREGVVAAARPLPFGTTIQLSDLREVSLPPDTGLVTVPWEDVDTLVGRLAATDVLSGQTLTPDAVTAQRSPAPGEAVVGLYLASGRAPATPLRDRRSGAGDRQRGAGHGRRSCCGPVNSTRPGAAPWTWWSPRPTRRTLPSPRRRTGCRSHW